MTGIMPPLKSNDYISSEESGTTKEAFISELGGSEIQPQNRLNVTDTNLPPERKSRRSRCEFLWQPPKSVAEFFSDTETF